MSSIDGWMSNTSPLFAPQAASRAVSAWNRILEKPSVIVLARGNTNLAAQTVRVEYDTSSMTADMEGPTGSTSKLRVVLFGIKDHPTLPDTNLQRKDRFAMNGQQFSIISIVYQTGEIQANCEALT